MEKSTFARAKEMTPYLPWCQDDPESLGQVTMQFIYDQEAFFRRWSQKWFENFQFVYGNHDMRWSKTWSTSGDRDFFRSERTRAINQKSQSNLARVVVEALSSFIFGNMPTWNASTAEESFHKGKRLADLCGKLLEAFGEQLVLQKDFSNAATIFATMGQVAARVDWDHRGGQLKGVPMYQKVRRPIYGDGMVDNSPFGLLEVPHPILDDTGNPAEEETWEPVMGPDGRQVIEWKFTGGPKVSILSPLEYRREPGSHGMHKTRYIQHIRLMDYDEYLYEFKNVEGVQKAFKTLSPQTVTRDLLGFALRHFMRMYYTTPPNMRDESRRVESMLSGNLFRHKMLVIEHFDKPNIEMWPRGRRLVVVNGQCTHVAEPDYSTNKADGWHPFCEAQWLNVAPNSIATGPLNDVVEKNKELNVYESLFATAAKRTMGSHLLIRANSGLDADNFSGTPGEIHEVTSDPQGVAHWLNDAQPIPPAAVQMHERLESMVFMLSGAQDALRGERSKNVSSGYALRQLQEREQARLIPARNQFARFLIAPIGEKMLACIKHNVTKLDDATMGYLKRNAAGGFDTEDVVSFLSTPIEFGVDVKVDPDSLQAKSKGTQQANLMELATKGPAAQRVTNDAAVLDNFLEEFDANVLRDASAIHRDRAKKENEIFSDIVRLGPDKAGIPVPQILFEDDDDIHIAGHTEHVVQNASEFQKNPWAMQEMLIHMETHRLQKKEKMAEVPPGTTQNMPAMYAAASNLPPPHPQQLLAEKAQLDQANAQQQQAQQQNPQQPTPKQQQQGAQGAKNAAPVGSKGPPQVNAQTPSQNTPVGQSQQRNTGTVQGGPRR